MKINGLENITVEELNYELSQGAKFVVYQYCVSIVVLTFKRGTDIYFIRSTEKGVAKGLPYTFLTLVMGWWGIPWGPIYTIQGLFRNLSGGKDVTDEVVLAMNRA